MIVERDGQKRRLPDFLIVGAAKSATTSLYAYLKQHPQIFLPERKEMYFLAFEDGEKQKFKLSDGTFHEPVGSDSREYFATYENSPENCIAGDASTWYLYFHDRVIKNIKKLYGTKAREPKIIIVLRNPIDRAWSHYSMHQRTGIINVPFREAITSGNFPQLVRDGYYPSYDYIGFGMYANQIQAYKNAFEHVKILLFEDLRDNPEAQVNQILEFLGLNTINSITHSKQLNVSGKPRSRFAAMISNFVYKRNIVKKILRPLLPRDFNYKLKMSISRHLFKKNPLSPEDRKFLMDIYREDILKLQELLGRDLSSWLALSSKITPNT